VAPLGVDTSIFNNSQKVVRNFSKCVFLNCGKWEKRKGHDLLLEMFRKAFPTELDVELWMMPSNPFLEQRPDLVKLKDEWERYYKSDSRVRIIDRVSTHQEVAEIMRATDCGIFPSRAEGWNLELLEMMALGKNVIATNYSAHTEFCNDQNSSLIEITDFETAFDGVFFDGSSGEWASLVGKPFDQAVQHMRHFYEKWSNEEHTYNMPGVETAETLSWSNTVDNIQKAMNGSFANSNSI